MQTSNFRVTVVEESDVVEICGALKVGFSPSSNKCSHLNSSKKWPCHIYLKMHYDTDTLNGIKATKRLFSENCETTCLRKMSSTIQHYIILNLYFIVAAEHCSSGSRFLWRPGIRRQHQGSSDSSWPDGDDRLRQVLLHKLPRVPCHLPGELRHRWPHHNLLRWTQPQDRGSFRQNRQSMKKKIWSPFFFICVIP